MSRSRLQPSAYVYVEQEVRAIKTVDSSWWHRVSMASASGRSDRSRIRASLVVAAMVA